MLDPPSVGRRAVLRAAFVTFHLACVLAYTLPLPPHGARGAAWAEHTIANLHQRFVPGRNFARFRQYAGLALQGYLDAVERLHGATDTYLGMVGSRQKWWMFSPDVPHDNRVGMIDVRPLGSNAFEPYFDGHSATALRVDFRHRKAQAMLFDGRRSDRRRYAAYWARRWEKEHPGQRLGALRFYYLARPIRPARDVLAGVPELPEEVVKLVAWRPPADGGAS